MLPPTLFDWVRYSGASVTVTVNPLHWRWLPSLQRETSAWDTPGQYTGRFTWLMLTVRVWIDDGSW